ncbi:MAG: group 1 truncated hemoglobin [Pseudomonadota bacterium]
MSKSLFDKYGGFSTVSKIVLTLYDRLLDDDDVGPFFDDVDLPSIIDHQTKFVSSLMGGPASFTDEHIQKAHQHLTICPHHFDRLQMLIMEVMTEFDVASEDIDAIVGAFEARRGLLVE